MCDKKNNILFNDIERIVLSPNFKLINVSQVLLRVPRKKNMYSVDLKNIVPKGGLTCLFAKSTSDESKLWHKRLSHLNFKTMNKLVKENLVRCLPSKLFENDQACVACQKGKQHRASCKSKIENSISLPLHLLHMDLFGPTFVKSLMKKMYCLVVTDDYSRFTWVFFLATKDETSGILKSFITRIENLVDHKIKGIRFDNRTEFKNREINQFCEMKGVLRQFSVARTPQQNKVAKRRNKTLIEAARTMLVDFKLPTTFWAEAVNTACYSINSGTKIVVENLHIRFSESTPNVVGSGPNLLFDIDALTRTINYEPIVACTQSNGFAGTKARDTADLKSSHDDGFKPSRDNEKKVDEDPRKENECNNQEKKDNVNSTNNVNTVSLTVNAAGTNEDIELPFDLNMPSLEDVSIFNFSNDDEDDGIVADMNNLKTTIHVSPISTTRIHKDHSLDQVIRDLHSTTQTRRMLKNLEEHGFDQKGNSCIERSKLDRGYAGRAFTIQVTRSLDFNGFTKWKKGYRPDIMFAVCAYARYQVNPKVSHLYDVKRIFRARLDMKSTTGESNTMSTLKFADTHNMVAFLSKPIESERVDEKKVIITEASIRRDLQLTDDEGVDCLPNFTIFEQLGLMGYEKVSQKLTFYKPFFSSQ
nr:putative ribonuclease H-like domain-containing protein [Tanacetum cinerariifolium]